MECSSEIIFHFIQSEGNTLLTLKIPEGVRGEKKVENPCFRVTNVLGLQWDTSGDTLKLKSVNYPQTDSLLTKRMLLARTSKLFDPLGIFSPITIKAKMLLQDSWKLQVGWDDPLPVSYIEQWKLLENELLQLEDYEIPRAIVNERQLFTPHLLRRIRKSLWSCCLVTQSKSQILTSKERVAPVKNRTIPQMELTALFIGTKLGKHIREKLNYLTIEHTYIWCDNEAVLQWVKNDHSKLPYVKNRVAKIYEMQNDFHFLYVDTKSNPADILSRGTTSKNLSNSILWFHGPQRLKEKPAWPDQNSMTFWVQEVQRECYSNEFRILHSLLENHPNKISEPSTKTLRQNKLIND